MSQGQQDVNTVITLYRRGSLARITSGAVSTLPAVTQIALGDGGVDQAGAPVAPEEGQTALKHEIKRYSIEPVGYPTDTSVQYSVVSPEEDLVGEKVSEMALVDAEGNLCAIRTFSAIPKDPDMKLTFTFVDNF